MATALKEHPVSSDVRVLKNGDRMSADEFHRIYKQMPADFRAELVGGVVYVASPLTIDHSVSHSDLNGLFWTYAGNTPGVECGDSTTVLLGRKGEPQPDVYLRVLPEYGGQSTTTADRFVGGAPELVAEVSYSSWAIDLNGKYQDYLRGGVLEYVVLDLHDRQLRWFDLHTEQELAAESDGVIRVRQFPGLWLHVDAVLQRDFRRMTATLNAGLASPDHAAFVKQLADRKKA